MLLAVVAIVVVEVIVVVSAAATLSAVAVALAAFWAAKEVEEVTGVMEVGEGFLLVSVVVVVVGAEEVGAVIVGVVVVEVVIIIGSGVSVPSSTVFASLTVRMVYDRTKRKLSTERNNNYFACVGTLC